MTPPRDYASITVSDHDGSVALTVACSDGLDERNEFLSKLGWMLLAEVRTGVISEALEADPQRTGEAMVVLEDDGHDSIDMQITFNPTVTTATGELSGAQALALSALQRVQHKLGLNAVTLESVTCD